MLLGQAGDRDDASIRELARAALALRPDRVVLKEMDAYLRGRAPGEVTRLMTSALIDAGSPGDAIAAAPTEVDAVRAALTWAEPGDLLVLGIHQDRRAVMAFLDSLRGGGGAARQPVAGACLCHAMTCTAKVGTRVAGLGDRCVT